MMVFAKDSEQVKFWLITGFNRLTCCASIPDPGLFRTRQEALDWCKQHSNESFLYGYQTVRLGRMT